MSEGRTCCVNCKARGLDTGVTCYEPRAIDCSRARWHAEHALPIYDTTDGSVVCVQVDRLRHAQTTGLVVHDQPPLPLRDSPELWRHGAPDVTALERAEAAERRVAELEAQETLNAGLVEIVHDTLWSEEHRSEDVGSMAKRVKRERDEAREALDAVMKAIHLPHLDGPVDGFPLLKSVPASARPMTAWVIESTTKLLRAEMQLAPEGKRNLISAKVFFGEEPHTLTLARGDFEHAVEKQRDEARAAYAVLRDAAQDFWRHIVKNGEPQVPDRVYIAFHQHALASEWPTGTHYIVERAEVEGGRWVSRIGRLVELIVRELRNDAMACLEAPGGPGDAAKLVSSVLTEAADRIQRDYGWLRGDEDGADMHRRICEVVMRAEWPKDARVMVYDPNGYGVRPNGERVGTGALWVPGKVEFVVDGPDSAAGQHGYVSVYCDDGRGRRVVPPWHVAHETVK